MRHGHAAYTDQQDPRDLAAIVESDRQQALASDFPKASDPDAKVRRKRRDDLDHLLRHLVREYPQLLAVPITALTTGCSLSFL
jgi:hypothetical protein